MADPGKTSGDWQEQARPPLLFKRFEFADYASTRAFLDAMGELAESSGMYPRNVSFASTHVNVTVDAEGEPLGEREREFARQLDALAGRGN
ncbi:MAG: 4a-hydroxytetrahydrobiopterin dehydratase [Betaproteobacteria bacterium]|nr:4a-hydroxytetrahydrobiopterin dehydratase [Betaproteobacteria bacterium]